MYDEVSDDFDDVARIVPRVLRFAAVFFPVWLVLLVLLPGLGAGAGGSLLVATLLALMAAWSVGRLRARRQAPSQRGRVGAPVRLLIIAIIIVLVLYAAIVLTARPG